MPERERKQKPAPKEREEEVVEDAPATNERGEKLKEEMDDLLDEIDSVLEDNAEEFVRNYVQKGWGMTDSDASVAPKRCQHCGEHEAARRLLRGSRAAETVTDPSARPATSRGELRSTARTRGRTSSGCSAGSSENPERFEQERSASTPRAARRRSRIGRAT